MRNSIFGLGYVGCVSLGCLAQSGHNIIGVDNNTNKVNLINNGKPTIIEKDIDVIISKAYKNNKISATSDYISAVIESDISIISVMVPKGLAAVVLASIPLQQGVAGGELIQNITYSVVLLSILFTSFLVLLLDKTGLPGLFGWVLSPDFTKLRLKTRTSTRNLSDETKDITPAGTRMFGSGDEDN